MLLKDMTWDGRYPNMRVDPAWREDKHPQETLPRVEDPVALYRPSPEVIAAPTAPVLAVVLVSNKPQLTWDPSESGITEIKSYDIYRGTDGATPTLLVNCPVRRDFLGGIKSIDHCTIVSPPEHPDDPWTTVIEDSPVTYLDTAAPAGHTYCYNVVGNPLGNNQSTAQGPPSPASNTVCVTPSLIHSWVDVSGHGFTGTIINSIAYGAGVWVAVGDTGQIATSPDGVTWTQRANVFAGTDNIDSVNFGNGLFVAISLGGTKATKIATSPDGITWTLRTSPFPSNLGGHSLAVYGGGLWVAFAYNKYATSPDGITWTLRNTYTFSASFGTNNNPDGKHLIYDGTNFAVTAVAADNATNVVSRSADGISWTELNVGAMGFATNASGGLAYNGSNLYIVGQGQRDVSATQDGKSGSALTSFPTLVTIPLTRNVFDAVTCIGFASNLWVMLTAQDGIATSADGVTFTSETVPADATGGIMTTVVNGNGLWLAVGSSSGLPVMIKRV